MIQNKKLSILLLSDYSNFHTTLAKGLRKLGCDVTVASDGVAFMECERDIDIRRNPGKIGGMHYMYKMRFPLLKKLTGYDIVSFRDPAFIELKPLRILWIMKKIMDGNKNCFLSYLTTDLPFLDMLEAEDSPLRYSEWFTDGLPNRLRLQDTRQWEGWHSPAMRKLNDYFYGRVKGAVTALYEYHLSAERIFPQERIAYGGIPIDTENITFREFDYPKKIRIFLGRDNRRKLQKGSDLLETAAKKVVEKYPDKTELIVLENKPRAVYMETMRSCHILLDQIYSYTPATMALEGMASGLTAITGAEPEFYEFIGEKDNFPIVNAPIELEHIEKCIESLVLHPEELAERGRKGREFVEKHNEATIVAKRFLDFWIKNI